MTIDELAAAAGVVPQTLRSYETGLRSGARVTTVRAIAEALGCRYRDLALLVDEGDRDA